MFSKVFTQVKTGSHVRWSKYFYFLSMLMVTELSPASFSTALRQLDFNRSNFSFTRDYFCLNKRMPSISLAWDGRCDASCCLSVTHPHKVCRLLVEKKFYHSTGIWHYRRRTDFLSLKISGTIRLFIDFLKRPCTSSAERILKQEDKTETGGFNVNSKWIWLPD